MKHRMIWAATAAGILLLAGCEGSTMKRAQVRPPAATPAPVPAYAQEPLPLPGQLPTTVSVKLDPRSGIDILVQEVQADVTAGQKADQSGDTAQGHTDFDHAVKLIVKSGFRPDADPRLSKLFDEIGQSLHAEEADASETTDEQEAETPAQPAPIDEIADMTLPAGDPRLELMARKEIMTVPHDLPLTVNEPVLQYLSFFTTPRGRAIVERGLERAGRYDSMIRRVLKQEGVPQDLIYLAQAESAFQPEAVSRSGARGIWQFMPYRGEQYDLERSYWIDERSDPEKATRAAARHLRDLYAMFGDWYLVMAAYNSGPLNVAKAIERTGYADFWQLQRLNALPKETQNYVPIIIALALVAKAPAMYGVQVDPAKPEPAEGVKLDHPVDLHLVSDATGADLDDLRLLNPQLLRTVTPNEPGFELKLPAGLTARFEQNLQQVPEDKWTSWRLHTVEDGETLAEIARRYHVTVSALEDANHLESHAQLPAGFLLSVPTAPRRLHLVRYRVRRGDTLARIADRFDVTIEELQRWNHIRGEHVRLGTRLRIYAGSVPAEIPSRRSKAASADNSASVRNVASRQGDSSDALRHRVKAGETLYSIARQYSTTVSALRESNPFLADRTLQAGDLLTIER
jgi:peptidoglycan lytic transglycosylase D